MLEALRNKVARHWWILLVRGLASEREVKWKVQTTKPMVAAITATAGDLVFTGNLVGHELGYDAPSGKELWRQAAGEAIGGV